MLWDGGEGEGEVSWGRREMGAESRTPQPYLVPSLSRQADEKRRGAISEDMAHVSRLHMMLMAQMQRVGSGWQSRKGLGRRRGGRNGWAGWGATREERGIIAITDRDHRTENDAEGLEAADRIGRREMGQIIRRGGGVLDDAEQRLGHCAAVDSSSDPAPPHRTPAPMDHPDSPRT